MFVFWHDRWPEDCVVPFFPVVIFSSCNWCVRILTQHTVIWDLFQPLVRRLYFFFRVLIFSGGSKNIAGQTTVPFLGGGIIFSCRNWCSYFDTSTNYGTYIPPEKNTTRKKGTVVQSKKEIHTNRKFGSHCFCKIKKPNKNFLKLKCDWWCSYFDRTDDQTTASYFFFPVIFFSSRNWCVRILTRQTVVWDLFQPSVRWLYLFFSGRNFFQRFKKHSRPDDCTFFFRSQFFRVVIGVRILTWAPNMVLTYDRKKLLPEKKVQSSGRPCFLAGSNYNRKKLWPEKKKVQSSGRQLK